MQIYAKYINIQKDASVFIVKDAKKHSVCYLIMSIIIFFKFEDSL